MKNIITLHDNKWISLLKMVYPEKKVSGYVYSHETRCNGHIVSILPFRKVRGWIEDEMGQQEFIPNPRGQFVIMEFLLREEITPCWNLDKPIISSITGGAEKGKTIEEIVCEEIEQEAGYIVKESSLINLGTSYGTKSSDTIYHLFSVDLSGKEKVGDASGDGSELEKLAQCVWYEREGITKAEDPFVYVSYFKLKEKGYV